MHQHLLRNPKVRAILLAATAFGGSSANAATYYISPSGNDANAGTSASAAWQTIAKVNTLDLNAGDQVLFQGGQTFNGNLSLTSEDGGTSISPVSIGSYGSGRATLSAGTGKGIAIYNVGGIAINNIDLIGASYANGNRTNGIEIYTDQGNTTKFSFIRVKNVDVSGFGDAGILLVAYPGDGTKSGFKDVRIEYVNAHDNADAGIESWGYFSQSSTSYSHENVYVGYCKTYNNLGITGKGEHSGNGIVLSDINGGLIERCVSYNNGQNSNYTGGGPVGIWTWDSNNITIQFNESYNNKTQTLDGGGFDFDGGVTNSVMQYNYSHDNDGAGYLFYQFGGARPFSGNIVRYNISQNDGRRNGYGGIFSGNGVNNCDIYNNTIFVSPQSNAGPRAVQVQSGTDGFRFRNNLFITTGGQPLVVVDNGANNITFQGNNYWSSGGAFNINWKGASYTSLSDWRNATGQEKNGTTNTGLSVDPKLVNAGGGGTLGDADKLGSLGAYQLQLGSPLIDAGLNLSSAFGSGVGNRDFYGNPVPQGSAFDIGAHESSATLGSGTGLNGQYYSGTSFNTLIKSQTDKTVNFDWGTGSPSNLDGSTMSSVGTDNFSVRWTGQVQAVESGTYSFETTTDDGVRLWVGNTSGTPLIDKWQPQGPTPYTATVTLSAGQKYDLKMEYFEGGGGASARLRWKRPGQSAFEVVPQSQLFPIFGGPYYRIKNRWKGNYIFDGGDDAKYGIPTATDTLYHWQLASFDTSYIRFINRATGDVLHIENNGSSVQCTPGRDNWWSSQWSQQDTGDGFKRFPNRWQTNKLIHVENQTGSVESGTIDPLWHSAHWLLEPVN